MWKKGFEVYSSRAQKQRLLKLTFFVVHGAPLAEQSATAGIVGRRNMQCLIKLKKQKKGKDLKYTHRGASLHTALVLRTTRYLQIATSLTSELADSSLLDYLRRRFAAS
jgi:hypothetical protein